MPTGDDAIEVEVPGPGLLANLLARPAAMASVRRLMAMTVGPEKPIA